MKTSESITKISPALVAALSAIKGAAKDGANEFFKRDGKATSYATLASVIDASREVLADAGLVAIQGLGDITDSALVCTTRIIHESGEWIESDFHMPLAKRDPQGAGSAATYARRYGLMAMLGMPAIDDDGEAAMDRSKPSETQSSRITPQSEAKDWWKADGPGPTAHSAKKNGTGDVFVRMIEEIRALSSAKDWREWCGENNEAILAMPKSWRIELRSEADSMAQELGVSANGDR